MAIQADAKMYDYQTGVATKLVPMSDGQNTYAPAVIAFQPLSPAEYDYIECSYTGTNLTKVVYKLTLPDLSKIVVATLDLTYDGSNNLLTVTRS